MNNDTSSSATDTKDTNQDQTKSASSTVSTETPSSNGKATQEDEKLLKVSRDYEEYKNRVEPVLETILSNGDLYKTVLDAHKKRFGAKTEEDTSTTSEDKNSDKDTKNNKDTQVEVSKVERDNRNALTTQIINKFSEEVGLNKLSGDEQKNMNIKIGNVLGRMIDPSGTSGKTLVDLIDSVSLVQLPQVLKDAYYLATREEREKQIAEQAVSQFSQNESGAIGTMSSTSISSQDVTLDAKERSIAEKMGISPEKYLERKRQILKNRGQIY